MWRSQGKPAKFGGSVILRVTLSPLEPLDVRVLVWAILLLQGTRPCQLPWCELWEPVSGHPPTTCEVIPHSLGKLIEAKNQT